MIVLEDLVVVLEDSAVALGDLAEVTGDSGRAYRHWGLWGTLVYFRVA